MTNILLKYGAIHNLIEDVRINDLAVETWKIDIKHLTEFREQMLVLFSKCGEENNYGGCIREDFITVAFYNNVCCDSLQSEIIDEADAFYVLDDYPIDPERKNTIIQQFSHVPWKNRLKYAVQDPFD